MLFNGAKGSIWKEETRCDLREAGVEGEMSFYVQNRYGAKGGRDTRNGAD